MLCCPLLRGFSEIMSVEERVWKWAVVWRVNKTLTQIPGLIPAGTVPKATPTENENRSSEWLCQQHWDLALSLSYRQRQKILYVLPMQTRSVFIELSLSMQTKRIWTNLHWLWSMHKRSTCTYYKWPKILICPNPEMAQWLSVCFTTVKNVFAAVVITQAQTQFSIALH